MEAYRQSSSVVVAAVAVCSNTDKGFLEVFSNKLINIMFA